MHVAVSFLYLSLLCYPSLLLGCVRTSITVELDRVQLASTDEHPTVFLPDFGRHVSAAQAPVGLDSNRLYLLTS